MPEPTDFPTLDATAADLADAEASQISKAQSGGVLVAALLAALSNFVLMFLGTRTLADVADQKEFLTFWSLLTGMFGVVSGVQNEATRAVGAVTRGRPGRVRMLWASLAWGGLVALLLLVLTPLLAHRVVPHSAWFAIPVMLVVTIAYSAYVTLVGGLAGRGWWREYAWLLCSEVVLRLALVVVVWRFAASLTGYEGAVAAATAVLFVFLLVSRRSRQALGSRADAAFGPLMRQIGLAVTSTASTALLVTAYPTVLSATNPATSAAQNLAQAGLILAVSLTRAPIMMPLTSFQSVAIRSFQEHRDAPLRALRLPVLALGGVGLVGAALAWPIGPWILPVFNTAYHVAGWVFAALVLSGVLVAVLTLLGTLVLALDAHLAYAAGWLLSSLVAIGLLLAPLGLAVKVVLSLSLGPLAGIIVLLLWLLRRTRR